MVSFGDLMGMLSQLGAWYSTPPNKDKAKATAYTKTRIAINANRGKVKMGCLPKKAKGATAITSADKIHPSGVVEWLKKWGKKQIITFNKADWEKGKAGNLEDGLKVKEKGPGGGNAIPDAADRKCVLVAIALSVMVHEYIHTTQSGFASANPHFDANAEKEAYKRQKEVLCDLMELPKFVGKTDMLARLNSWKKFTDEMSK
ncbi:hypothetical protein DRQ53_14085 [bacterium]|nr:MAG: hypothetical protein DRQ53_14085 [bacterium]